MPPTPLTPPASPAALALARSIAAEQPLRYDEFLFAIAHHVAPDPSDEPGMACIMGKRCFHKETESYTTTDEMSPVERDELAQLLKEHAHTLPNLHPRMTDGEITHFLNAYRSIDKRPMQWEPRICSQEDRRRLRERRGEIRLQHNARIIEAIAQGRIRLFDANRVAQSAPHFQIRSFLTSEDAEAYLQSAGLSLAEIVGGVSPSARIPIARSISSPSPLVSEAPAPRTPPSSTASNIAHQGSAVHLQGRSNRTWSDKDKRLAVTLYESEFFDEGAAEFGISSKKFKQYAKRWKEERDSRAPMAAERISVQAALHDFGRTIVVEGKKIQRS